MIDGGRKQSVGENSKDRKSAGDERKDRLAAELRANLKRRKEKTKAPGVPQVKQPEKPDAAGGQ